MEEVMLEPNKHCGAKVSTTHLIFLGSRLSKFLETQKSH